MLSRIKNNKIYFNGNFNYALAGFRQDKLIRFTYTIQEQVIIIPMIQFILLQQVCIAYTGMIVCLLDKMYIYDTQHFPILFAMLRS